MITPLEPRPHSKTCRCVLCQPPILTGSRGGGKTSTQARKLAEQLALSEALLARVQREPMTEKLLLDIREYFSQYERAALLRSMKGKNG